MTIYEEVDLLRAACCIAGLDQQISPEEMKILKEMAREAGVGAASFNAMLDLAVNDKDFYEKQLGWARSDPERTLALLVKVARADGKVDQLERIITGFFAEKIGLTPEQASKALATENGG